MKQRGRTSVAALTAAPAGTLGRPQPPKWLGKRAREIFDELVTVHDPIFFRHTVHLLASFCAACERHEQAAALLEKEGLVVQGNTGPKANPANAIMCASVALMIKLATKLRITNQSRYRNDSAKLRTVSSTKPWEFK